MSTSVRLQSGFALHVPVINDMSQAEDLKAARARSTIDVDDVKHYLYSNYWIISTGIR